ncbi:glycoside hydrolase superfamily [Xylariomycetidae sp. FL0641]|nr:glycoside hydrolase superfamily [Xylariomycetidae sp. FL0641]
MLPLISALASTAALFAGASSAAAISAVDTAPAPAFDWRTFQGDGVNLGGWLEQEEFIDAAFWAEHGGNATDEWSLCEHLGDRCGPVLEQRYATYITTDDVDVMAAGGVRVLRVPTTYAAWVRVPGSRLHSGDQVKYLTRVANYAIERYGMHVIIDLHSLPGGVNGMGFGEKTGHFGWFHNATALEYSYRAVEAVIAYVAASPHPRAFTLEPINEPVDNPDLQVFGTAPSLTPGGAEYLAAYFHGVLERVRGAGAGYLPVMVQGGFRYEDFWSPRFDAARDNVVFDTHQYYYVGRPTTSLSLPYWLCADARALAGDGRFPVFVGEWSVQATRRNLLGLRAVNLNTGLRAWSRYARGSAYWTEKFRGTDPVDGQGDQGDYWNYEEFITRGLINPLFAIPCELALLIPPFGDI